MSFESEEELFSFDDSKIDFVLAYNDPNLNQDKREVFETNLKEAGLILEKEEIYGVYFLKIHIPQEVLFEYGELLKFTMPIKYNEEDFQPKSRIAEIFDKIRNKLTFDFFDDRRQQLNAVYTRDKSYLFDVTSPDFFNDSARISVISYILDNEKFAEGKYDKGIKQMLAKNIYTAAYPLHDGMLTDVSSTRRKLLDNWASWASWSKFQPLDEIRNYLGVKFALYFAWLGFYNQMLIPLSIIGVICFIYGFSTLSSDSLSTDICNANITMCPLCDKFCPFWSLNETCGYSKIAYMVDNPATLWFSVIVAIWSAVYLELWQRYSADLTHRWGLKYYDSEDEPARPDYTARSANLSSTYEKWKFKLTHFAFTWSIILFWLLLALAMMFGVMLYRMSLATSETLNRDYTTLNLWLVPITAGLINLIGIMILNHFYDKIVVWLTDKELHRTQNEYEDSLTLKTYLFQFVNYFTSVFYIAFFKGKFVGDPHKYYRIFGYRQEECHPGGCLIELTIQIFILMIGQNALDSLIEYVQPWLTWARNKCRYDEIVKNNEMDLLVTQRVIFEDYKLSSLEPKGLFSEYLEMVLQFGLITIFVTAFPLAPLFALVNNICELRMDATKMIRYFRRPVPKRVKDIGVWLEIMNVICKIAIITNGFIIAFSSQIVPRLVYNLKRDTINVGFLEYSLAYFNVRDFEAGIAPIENPRNVTSCRFQEFRNPVDYWLVMAARLAFLVLYQNIVGFVYMCVRWIIPDIPSNVAEAMKIEAVQVKEAIVGEAKIQRSLRRLR